MIDYLGMVREFHEKYDHLINDKPTIPSNEIIELRARLILEECHEFCDASNIPNITFPAPNLISIADSIADLLYVTFGTALAYGIPIDEVFKEVHRSNMTKSTEKDSMGKTIKGDYSPADIKSILGSWRNK